MIYSLSKPANSRLGYHYFPDTFHYQISDLKYWLPVLSQLGASWLTVQSPVERAIPEFFLTELSQVGIKPVVHMIDSTIPCVDTKSMELLIRTYAKWGVKYIALFDRPNVRSCWGAASWAQNELVETFLDRFLILAELMAAEGVVPLFSPLEPGGDYWDLAFLQAALQGIQRRGSQFLIDRIGLSAYAWTGNRSLEWGAGGPERWPATRPYSVDPMNQDHCGFRIFDWYLSLAEKELGRRTPIILLRAGTLPNDYVDKSTLQPDLSIHSRMNLLIAQLMEARIGEGMNLEPVSSEVLACNFWLLASDPTDTRSNLQAWFQTEGKELPVVHAFQQWITEVGSETLCKDSASRDHIQKELSQKEITHNGINGNGDHPIDHYVLLPLFAWGAASWELTDLQPVLSNSHPTVGFSITEAQLAARVTVVGGEGAISESALSLLRSSGCQVERICEDGTLVAT